MLSVLVFSSLDLLLLTLLEPFLQAGHWKETAPAGVAVLARVAAAAGAMAVRSVLGGVHCGVWQMPPPVSSGAGQRLEECHSSPNSLLLPSDLFKVTFVH